MPTFGLNCNPRTKRPETAPTALRIIGWGNRTDNKILLSEYAADLLDRPEESVPDEELRKSVDVMISLGGDGTMLNTARRLAGAQIPILGVNVGSLGFLTETPLVELEEDLERIVIGDYETDLRMTLDTIYEGEKLPPALNDVVIDRGAISRIINIDLFRDSEPVASYQADGLILATPTGSTAYSLSVGGPILAPDMQAIIASPISAFGFGGRPFVFSAEREIEVRVYSEHGSSALTIDGQVTRNLPGQAVFRVRKGKNPVKMIRFHDSSFYKVLRRKLNWGAPPVEAD